MQELCPSMSAQVLAAPPIGSTPQKRGQKRITRRSTASTQCSDPAATPPAAAATRPLARPPSTPPTGTPSTRSRQGRVAFALPRRYAKGPLDWPQNQVRVLSALLPFRTPHRSAFPWAGGHHSGTSKLPNRLELVEVACLSMLSNLHQFQPKPSTPHTPSSNAKVHSQPPSPPPPNCQITTRLGHFLRPPPAQGRH